MAYQTQMNTDALSTVAFNRAMAEYADGLKGFAARMLRDDVMAEDMAQDAFLALYRNMHKVPESAFRPWLYRVTRNLCLDQLRRRKFKMRLFRDLSKDSEFELVPEDTQGIRPDQHAESEEARIAMEEAIENLPAKFREAFLLCEVQGLSYEEAASIMDCPVKTVSTRLFRARQRFRTAVAKVIKV